MLKVHELNCRSVSVSFIIILPTYHTVRIRPIALTIWQFLLQNLPCILHCCYEIVSSFTVVIVLRAESLFPVGHGEWLSDWSKLRYVQLPQHWLADLQNGCARLSAKLSRNSALVSETVHVVLVEVVFAAATERQHRQASVQLPSMNYAKFSVCVILKIFYG